jgi:hypothetical protein
MMVRQHVSAPVAGGFQLVRRRAFLVLVRLFSRAHMRIIALCRERLGSLSRSGEGLREPSEDAEVGVKLDAGKAANAKRGKAVVMLQAAELAFHGTASFVEALEPLAMARDAREQPATERERHHRLLATATERDDRLATALLNLGVDAGVVVALVCNDRFGPEAASAERVEERGDEVGLLPSRRLDSPRERQLGLGANSGVDLVAVEPAALAGGNGAAVPPRGIGVGERLALPTVLADVAHPVGVGREVGSVYRYVTSKIRVLLAERSGYRVDAVGERGVVRAQLPGEAVAGPDARGRAESRLQARVFSDEGGYPRPGREGKQTFDEASADEGAGAEALALSGLPPLS